MINISLFLIILFLVVVFILSKKAFKDQWYFIGIGVLLIFLSLLKCDLNIVFSSEHVCMLMLQNCSDCLFSYFVPIGYGVVLSGILGLLYTLIQLSNRN